MNSVLKSSQGPGAVVAQISIREQARDHVAAEAGGDWRDPIVCKRCANPISVGLVELRSRYVVDSATVHSSISAPQ